jgi:thiamine pyrophosphokinase
MILIELYHRKGWEDEREERNEKKLEGLKYNIQRYEMEFIKGLTKTFKYGMQVITKESNSIKRY